MINKLLIEKISNECDKIKWKNWCFVNEFGW